jgi:hypothetical protein
MSKRSPSAQRHVERRLDDSVPQARDRQDGPLDRGPQPGKVGHAVEHEQHRQVDGCIASRPNGR